MNDGLHIIEGAKSVPRADHRRDVYDLQLKRILLHLAAVASDELMVPAGVNFFLFSEPQTRIRLNAADFSVFSRHLGLPEHFERFESLSPNLKVKIGRSVQVGFATIRHCGGFTRTVEIHESEHERLAWESRKAAEKAAFARVGVSA